jgi:hypothetical protein
MRTVLIGSIIAACLVSSSHRGVGGLPAEDDTKPVADAAEPAGEDDVRERAIVSGQVVSLAAAFKKRGVKSYDDEIKGQYVLLTRTGEIVPIVPDWRGRAFYQDERLRDRPVDLLVIRRRGVPWVQVLSIYTFDEEGARTITDYWCDVCSIPMYEIKECECCQGPIRLRFRPQELPRDLDNVKGPEKDPSASSREP